MFSLIHVWQTIHVIILITNNVRKACHNMCSCLFQGVLSDMQAGTAAMPPMRTIMPECQRPVPCSPGTKKPDPYECNNFYMCNSTTREWVSTQLLNVQLLLPKDRQCLDKICNEMTNKMHSDGLHQSVIDNQMKANSVQHVVCVKSIVACIYLSSGTKTMKI